ncbi:MAG TPA: hypothetical protein VMN99_03755, partial [Anaerolineales bacterium]|nr:hypothetical protein [Anaerolineales bacterium]
MNKPKSSFLRWRTPTRYPASAFLLAAQLVSLVLYAVFDANPSGRALLGAFGILILALVVWVINRRAMISWIAWLLVAPAFILSLLSALFDNRMLLMWSSLLEAILYFYGAGSLIAYMMEDYRVTTDELFAAGATFTLLAWGFAFVYLACQIWFPGSFIGVNAPSEPRTFVELLSLSFANLSATGLGDILPI